MGKLFRLLDVAFNLFVQFLCGGELLLRAQIFDEFHIDVLGTNPELVVEHSTSTVNGTASSVKSAAAFDLTTLSYQVEEIDDFTGTPVITVQQASVDVRSTEPTDQGKRVRIVFKPATDWVGTEWSDEGA